jgi:2-phospho-L-lactate guanylyltransferase
MTDQHRHHVSIVIPAKHLDSAKSRLALPPDVRRDVALHLLVSTITAALSSHRVGRVLVVTSDPTITTNAARLGAMPIAERPPYGLNSAVGQGRAVAARLAPSSPIGVLLGDLPDLSVADLNRVIAEFNEVGHPLMVSDRAGSGTTFIIHAPKNWPPALFGANSAAAHTQAGYRPATGALTSLRHDVDTLEDLKRLERLLPTGAATSAPAR